MSPFFDQIERDLVSAAARRAAPARGFSARALAIAAALLLGCAGTAAAATYYVLRASPIAPFGASTPEQTVEPGTSRVLDLRSPDPEAGQPPWALRLSRSRTGLLCGTVGQVEAAEFGLLGLDGRFRGVPEANADACGDDVVGDATLLGMRVFDGAGADGVRTVVNGVAKDLERVTVAVRGRPAQELQRSPEGGFVLALRGYPEDVQPEVTLRFAGGREIQHVFARDPFIVPDPLGERAWRVEMFAFGRPMKPGQKLPPPTYNPSCVRFGKARHVRGAHNASARPVCGVKPVFFTTRRLSGDREPGDALLTGDWNGHPPRTAVYGRAGGEVVVTAPGVRETVQPTVNGAFLVVLPPSVRPAEVSVTVGGRRHGPTLDTVKDPHPR